MERKYQEGVTVGELCRMIGRHLWAVILASIVFAAAFTLLFAFVMLVLSLVPQVAYWVSDLFGFQSPINVVYIAIIFILLVKQFFMSIQLSQMDSKLRALTQKVALNEEKIEREKDDL